MRRWLFATLAIAMAALTLSAPTANAQPLDTETGVPVAVETPAAATPLFSYDCESEADPPEFTVRGTPITGYVQSGCDYPLPAGQITDAYIEERRPGRSSYFGHARRGGFSTARSRRAWRAVSSP